MVLPTRRVVPTAIAVAFLAVAAAAAKAPPAPEMITKVPGNTGADSDSYECAVSASGRFVAFDSAASNIADGDSNGAFDIFLRDRKAGTTTPVSVTPEGASGNGSSSNPSVSGNGRFVIFASLATDLVGGSDLNGQQDVFLRDLKEGTTRRLSSAPGGSGVTGVSTVYGNSITTNGRYAVFSSNADGLVPEGAGGNYQVYLADLRSGTLRQISHGTGGDPGNGNSTQASLSATGRFVAFSSTATDLVEGDGNGVGDAFVYDVKTGAMRLASVDTDGVQGNGSSQVPVVSKNGAVVAFQSQADNLVADDTNGQDDVFVHDFRTGATTRVSLTAEGAEVDQSAQSPSLSQNGKVVVFTSYGTLVPQVPDGDGHTYAFDRRKGTLRLLSASAQGTPGDGDDNWTTATSLSANGRWCVISSNSTNLAGNDKNGSTYDIFLLPAR